MRFSLPAISTKYLLKQDSNTGTQINDNLVFKVYILIFKVIEAEGCNIPLSQAGEESSAAAETGRALMPRDLCHRWIVFSVIIFKEIISIQMLLNQDCKYN